MKIKIAGESWRKYYLFDMIRRLGILAQVTDDESADMILVSENVKDLEVDRILDFARNGKIVVFLQPESRVLKYFGDELMYTHHFPLMKLDCDGILASFLQVFPPVCLIKQKQGENYGAFAFDFSRSGENYTTKYPAITLRNFGSGKICLFLYDFISTMLLLLQGWEFFTSEGGLAHQSRLATSRARHLSDHLINKELYLIPQAYFHELLLLYLLRRMARPKDPLPRIWYYPSSYTAAFLLNGDSDNLEKKYLEKAWNMLLKKGLKYTQYIMTQDIEKFSSDEISCWSKKGIDFGLHYFAGISPSEGEMLDHITEARKVFEEKGQKIISCRGHSCIWVGWDGQIKIMEKSKILYSSNLLYWHPGVSYGFPYNLYKKSGRSSVQELQIFCSDDVMLFNKSGMLPLKPVQYMKNIIAWLDINNDLYYQPVNPIFHPFYLVKQPSTSEILSESVEFAKSKDIIVTNHKKFFQWWEKRKRVKLTYKVVDDSIQFDRKELDPEIAIAVPEQWKVNVFPERKMLKGTCEKLFYEKRSNGYEE
ncbi:MAG: hypothetical protein NC831_02780 [Candidatus Omnitrophica bacterium]|nr:hypothetical protein [Candidatus Omnitrophota bacterium]